MVYIRRTDQKFSPIRHNTGLHILTLSDFYISSETINFTYDLFYLLHNQNS